jgi:glycosyltransferase involved in cell wall biosynthesis
MTKNDLFVSVVIVTDNDAEHIVLSLQSIYNYLRLNFLDFEIVVVDQRSKDGTQDLVVSQLKTLSSIRFIELAFPVAFDVAMGAALENSIGDFVIIMAPNLDPVDCIEPLVSRCRTNSDIVIGVANNQKVSIGYRLFRPLANLLLHDIGYDLPRNSTSLRCLSRRAVNAVTHAGKFHHQLYVRMNKTGFPSSSYHYTQLDNKHKKTLSNGLQNILRLLVFNSTRPLRWLGAIGIFVGSATFIIALYSLFSSFARNEQVQSTSVLFLLVSVMLISLFIMLSFFGEYLGRLLDDRGVQNAYSVACDLSSSVIVDDNHVNVLTELSSNSP